MSLLATDELYLINSDTKYKSYMTSIEKALKNFESSTEWADLIASLGKLKKIIQSFPKYQFIPKKLSISKRLSQCLHPALPSGVHLKALEVYTIIFQNIGRENLSRDLSLYANGLFPLLANAALSVKPVILGLYETYFLPLRELLRPCLVGIILAVLPGLEEGSDFYTRSFNLLKNICLAQAGAAAPAPTSAVADDKYFHTCLWSALIAQPSARFPAIQFILINYENKRKTLMSAQAKELSVENKEVSSRANFEDQLYLIGNSIDLMINGICLCLQDSNPLVQRSILDFLCLCLPMDTQQITKEDKLQLIVVAIHVILRRDMSLNRRIYSWLTGNVSGGGGGGGGGGASAAETSSSAPPNGVLVSGGAAKKANFFQTHSKNLLINAIKVLLNNFTELIPSSNFGKQPILYLQIDESYISTPHTSNVLSGLANLRTSSAVAAAAGAAAHSASGAVDFHLAGEAAGAPPRAILNNINQTSTSVSTNSTLKILKILSNLVERPEIGSAIVQEILLDLLLRIQNECDQLIRHGCELSSGNKNLVIFQTALDPSCADKSFVNQIINPTNRTRNAYSETIFQLKMRELNELKKATANFLFQSFQINFIFEFLSASFERICAQSCSLKQSRSGDPQLTISNICDLYEFLLELVTKSEMFTDVYTHHLSLMLKDTLKTLEAYCPRMSNGDLSKSFVLCVSILEKISSRVSQSSPVEGQAATQSAQSTASASVKRGYQESVSAAASAGETVRKPESVAVSTSNSSAQLAKAASQNQSFESKSSSEIDQIDQIVAETVDSIIKAIETENDYEPASEKYDAPPEEPVVEPETEPFGGPAKTEEEECSGGVDQAEDCFPIEYSLFYLKELVHKFFKSHVFSLLDSGVNAAGDEQLDSNASLQDEQISQSFESVFKTGDTGEHVYADSSESPAFYYADLIRKCFNVAGLASSSSSASSSSRRAHSSYEDMFGGEGGGDSGSQTPADGRNFKFIQLKQEDCFKNSSRSRDSNACEYLPAFQLLNKLLIRVFSFPQRLTIKNNRLSQYSLKNGSGQNSLALFDFWFKDLVVACCCSRFDSKLSELDKMSNSSSIRSEMLEPRRILFEYQVTALNTILKLVNLSESISNAAAGPLNKTPSMGSVRGLFEKATDESNTGGGRLEPILSKQQTDLLLRRSFFGISSALSLWSYLAPCGLETQEQRPTASLISNNFEKRASILFCLLHEILPNNFCEDIIAHGLLYKNAGLNDNTVLAVRMDSFERFTLVWYWSRILKINVDNRRLGIKASYVTKMERDIDILENENDEFSHFKTLLTAPRQPAKTFERSLFLVYDILGSAETPKVFASQIEHWFLECVVDHEDLSRLLDSLLVSLLSPQTARVSIQSVLRSCTLLNSSSKIVVADSIDGPGGAGGGSGGGHHLRYLDPVSSRFPYRSAHDAVVVRFFEHIEGTNVVCNKNELNDESKIYAISHEDGNVTYHVNNTAAAQTPNGPKAQTTQQQQQQQQLLLTAMNDESPSKMRLVKPNRNIELPAPILNAALLKNQQQQSIQIKINPYGRDEESELPSYSRITPRAEPSEPSEKAISGETTTGSARVLTEPTPPPASSTPAHLTNGAAPAFGSGSAGGKGLKIASNHRISSYDELNLDYDQRPYKATNGVDVGGGLLSKSNNDLSNKTVSPNATMIVSRKAGTLEKTGTGGVAGGASRSNVRKSFNENAMRNSHWAEKKPASASTGGAVAKSTANAKSHALNWVDISRPNFVDPNYAHMLVYCNCSNVTLEINERRYHKDEVATSKYFLPDDFQLPAYALGDEDMLVVRKLSVQTISSSPFFNTSANTFDHGQTLFVLRCIEQMLIKCRSDFLVAIATTRIKPSGPTTSSSRTRQTGPGAAARSASTYSVFNEKLVDTILRHLESMHGINFYTGRDDSERSRIRAGKVDFTEMTYLETIVLVLLFYIRSYYLPSRFSIIRTLVEQAPQTTNVSAAAGASESQSMNRSENEADRSRLSRGLLTHSTTESESYISADERSATFELKSSSLNNLNRKANADGGAGAGEPCRKTKSNSDIYSTKATAASVEPRGGHEATTTAGESSASGEERRTGPCPDLVDQRDNTVYIENRNIQIYCIQLLNKLLQELLKLCQFSVSERPMLAANGLKHNAASAPNYLQIVEGLFARCELPKVLLHCFSANASLPQANSMASCILRPKFAAAAGVKADKASSSSASSSTACKYALPDRRRVDLSYTCELMVALENVIKFEKLLKDYQSTLRIQSRLTAGAQSVDSLGARDRSVSNDLFLLTLVADSADKSSSGALNRPTSFAGSSASSAASFIQNQVVSNQSMFISTVLHYLKHLNLVEYHLPVLSLIRNTLAASGSALKSLATFVIEQLCRNLLQIANDVNLLLISSNISHKLPNQKSYEALLARALGSFVSLHENPNLVLALLGQLAAILNYCLVNSKSIYLSDITNGLISLAVDESSASSDASSSSLLVDYQIKVLKSHLADKENDLQLARESLLNLLPNILTCMCHLWHRSNILTSYASKTSSNNWNALNVQISLLKNSIMLGDPIMINKSITELLNPIAAFHSQSFIMAITIVWGEKRKRFKSSHVHIVNEQPVLVELVGSLKSFQLPTLLSNVVEFLRANCTKEKKKTANCVWILQFLHSYLEYFWSSQFAKLTGASPAGLYSEKVLTVNEVASSMMSFYKECLMTSLTSNLTPVCYFQLMKILHDSLNMTPVLIDEKKFSKDLQDFTHKLFELCNSIVASSLQQTTWLRKNFAVKLTPVAATSASSAASNASSSGYQSGSSALNASQSNLTASSPSGSLVGPGGVGVGGSNGHAIMNESASTIASATRSGSMENISSAFESAAGSSSQVSTNLASSVSTMNFTGVSASPSLSDYGMAESLGAGGVGKSGETQSKATSAGSFLKMDEISEALAAQQNMVDVNSYYYAEPNNEIKENYSLQALNILADYLPKIFDIVYKSEEKERLTVPLLMNLMSNLWPFLKTHSIANKNNYRAASLLLMHFTNYPYTRKTWKKEVFELLFDSSYFHVDFVTLDYWRVIVDNLISNDRSMFKDVLIRVTYQQSSGLFTSKEQESDQKALLLKRLAFVIFASERDQYQKHMPEIQECIAHVLKLIQSANVYSSLFLLFRILLLRVSSRHLIALWPTILSEVIVILLQMELDLNDDNDLINMRGAQTTGSSSLKSNPSSYASLSSNILPSSQSASQQTLSNSQYQLDYVVYASSSIASFNVNSKLQTYLSVCKLIDLILALPSSITSQFQFHKWCFYSDHLPLGKQPEQFIPYLIKLNNLFQAKYPGVTAQDLDVRNRLAESGSHPESELRLYTASYRDKKTLGSLRDLKGFFECISKNAYVKNSLTTNQQYFVLQHNQAKQQNHFITPIQPASQQNINSIFLKLYEPSVQEDFVESWIE